MQERTCIADRCERTPVCKGCCDRHYRRLKKYGDVNTVMPGNGQWGQIVPIEAVSSTPCLIEDCGRPKDCRGWCRVHYRRWLRNGDPLATHWGVEDTPCNIEDCNEVAFSGGRCGSHHARYRRHGDPLAGGAQPKRAIDHDNGDRTCTRCGVRKSITEFFVASKAVRGRTSVCGECAGVESSTRYASNKAYYDDQAKKYRHQRRALIQGQTYDPGITRSKLRDLHGDHCLYCSEEMDFNSRGREFIPAKATIEHVLPVSRGGSHTWDNTRLCCLRCNCSKGDKTIEEWSPEGEHILVR